MRLNAPKKLVWTIALILGIIGLAGWIVGVLVDISIVPLIAFWVVAVGLALVLLATLVRGM